MKRKDILAECSSALSGKTVAISGATGGIGKELCNYFASFGAHLLLLDRNPQKSRDLISRLKGKYPGLQAHHITIDLSDIYSVEAALEKLYECIPDIFILNAGAYHIPRFKCATGFNNVFQINFASPYYLVKKIMPKLLEKGGRVVAVSSIAHNYSHINKSDIDFSGYKASSKVYGNAKRFLTFSLAELFDGTNHLSICHPGITFTNITNHYPKLIFALIKHPMKIIFMKPSGAALNILYASITNTDVGEWIGPRIFNIWGSPQKIPLKTCKRAESKAIYGIAEGIYKEICEKITKI